jgi:phosphoglycolate phosphatase
MTFEAVMFDLDGTLLNTLGDVASATNRMLSKRNYPTHPVESFRFFLGDGAKMLVIRSLPEDQRDEATIRSALAEFVEDYDQNCTKDTFPYPGIPDLLDGLTERGIRLAVFTNKPNIMTARVVSELLPKWDFEVVMGASDALPRKPDPAGALEIARRMNISPSNFLYLGDSGVDMHTAHNAGMFPVGVLWGFRPKEELLEAGAQAFIETPLDALGLLNANR